MKKENSQSLFIIAAIMVVLTALEIFLFSQLNIIFHFWIIILANLLILGLVILWLDKNRIRRLEIISAVNHLSEETLQNTLKVLPVAIIKFNPQNYNVDWYNEFAEFMFKAAEVDISADLVKQLIDEYHEKSKYFPLSDHFYSVDFDKANDILYLQDVTNEKQLASDLSERRPVIGAVAIDNYDDVTDPLSESQRSRINSFITNFLESFSDARHMYLRRQSADRYVFFTNYQVLSDLMKEHFTTLLDDFRKHAAGEKLSLSLSLGISYGVVDYTAIGKTALNNLELALIRGGDQAVVRENEDMARAVYFGGNSESRVVKSRTRVRAISSMLKTIVLEADQVFIVGHRFPDMDALGASAVIRNFAAAVGREAFIVYNEDQLQDDTKRAIDALNKDENLFDHVLRINSAKKMKVENSLLIMVDHSKISRTLDKEFYESFEKVVVIDHHRRDEDFPENPLLTYIDSAASSATEMAVEILQFQNRGKTSMTSIEASVALAGISVDTKSFTKATTSKTFDAASYLRYQGADNEIVQKLLATDFETFKEVNEVVLAAVMSSDGIAVALGKPDKVYEKVSLAKAADELLTMSGVAASFTLALGQSGDIEISARSNGKINVQVIMEKMGGGGHFDTAATTFPGQSLADARAALIQVISEKD
ncbi:MAG: DHH family phosphoesterase [Streptococcaceae bacterium]|jgi:c-di-AMP phosphodiesterase-like protein|nr:DHH family phosphoesterase [Streptococcaceae bacterium]